MLLWIALNMTLYTCNNILLACQWAIAAPSLQKRVTRATGTFTHEHTDINVIQLCLLIHTLLKMLVNTCIHECCPWCQLQSTHHTHRHRYTSTHHTHRHRHTSTHHTHTDTDTQAHTKHHTQTQTHKHRHTNTDSSATLHVGYVPNAITPTHNSVKKCPITLLLNRAHNSYQQALLWLHYHWVQAQPMREPGSEAM